MHPTEVLTRGGYFDGSVIPPHNVMYLRVAPDEQPAAAVAFATRGGGTHYLWAAEVLDLDVHVDGRSFFGLGIGGMVAAGLASALDSLLAPWQMSITMRNGDWLQLYAQRGPAPRPELLVAAHARCSARLASPAAQHEHDTEVRELVEELEAEAADLLEVLVAEQEEADPDGTQSEWLSNALLSYDWTAWAQRRCAGDASLLGMLRRQLHRQEDLDWANVDDVMQWRWLARQVDKELHDGVAEFPSYSEDAPGLPETSEQERAVVERAAAVVHAWASSGGDPSALPLAVPVDEVLRTGRLVKLTGFALMCAASTEEESRAAADVVECGQYVRDNAEASGATYHWYSHGLDLTAMRVMDAWWQEVDEEDADGSDAGGYAVALCGAQHAMTLDLRLLLHEVSLVLGQESAGRMALLLVHEVGRALAQLGLPANEHVPGRPAEFVWPR